VYSCLSCVTCCLCFVKPCCMIASDENYRYVVLKRNLAKCAEIYGEDWRNATRMNTLFLRVVEVIEAALVQLRSRKQWLEDQKLSYGREYENNPADMSTLDKMQDVNLKLLRINPMVRDDDEFVHSLLEYVRRHHNPNTDMLRTDFPIMITHYDMTLLRAAIPLMSLAFDNKPPFRIDDIIEIDTRVAYQLVSI
jgi:hypothetical protein